MIRDSRLFLAWEDLVMGIRFFFGVPWFLRHPITPAEARATLRRRLDRREVDFLALVRETVYGHAESPYRQLLRLAGCEYRDLEKLVTKEGVEGALHTLFRRGVYLTVEEFKGRRPVMRGSATITVAPRRFRNPLSVPRIPAWSSASRGDGTPVPIDFAFVRDRAVNLSLILAARNAAGWSHAFWAIPGGAVIVQLLELAATQILSSRWFSQVDPAAPGLHPRYRWSVRAMRWGGLLARAPLPGPEYVPLADPLAIVHWMTGVLRTKGTPHLSTFPSSAVGVCEAASAEGIELRGAQFTIGGEPTTAARLATIQRVGAQAIPNYGSIECPSLGRGCLAPAAPDDLHMLHDLYAMIQPGPSGTRDVPPHALLVSSLRQTAPFVLLNFSMGDEAVVTKRRCGCPLERLGWTTHLHTIRSFEKLTAGGMAFLDTDVIRVLEEVLPAGFGGGPTDFQLVEDEAEGGAPCLRLRVHPRLGLLNPAAVTETFLAAIGHGSGVERMMGMVWREGNFLRVEREAPLATASGKILHLHVDRRPRAPETSQP